MFRPLTSAPAAREHVTVEVLQADDGRFVACGILRDTTMQVCTSRKAAIEALSARKMRGVVYWVLGLDRVAGALFGKGLPDGLQIAAGAAGLICGRWRDGQPTKSGRRRITRKLWDLVRHYDQATWENLGELTGCDLPSWEPPANWKPRPTTEEAEQVHGVLSARCQALMKAVRELERFYIEHNTETMPSVASSSLRAWRRNDQPTFKFDRWIPPQPWKLSWMRGALYGGRSEAYQLGHLDRPMETFDVASQYPYLCTVTKLPCVSEPWTWIKEREPKAWRDRPSIIEATVSVPDMPLPPLPYRRPEDGQTVYPTGRIRGRWHGSELVFAESLGVRILEVHAGVAFSSSDYYLKAHAERFWEVKRSSPPGSLRYIHAKAMLNAPIGKWAQRPGITEVLSPDEAATWKRRERLRLDQAMEAGLPQVPRVLRCWPPMADTPTLYIADGEEDRGAIPPSHVNVFWSGEIYAQGRIMLLRAMLSNWSSLVMADTDSMTGEGIRVETSDQLGGWELETSWDALTVRGPKQYAGVSGGRWVATVAGLGGDDEGARLRYVDQGNTAIERRCGFMESLHRPFEPGQMVTDYRHSRKVYDRRQWSDIEERWMPVHVHDGTDRWILEET